MKKLNISIAYDFSDKAEYNIVCIEGYIYACIEFDKEFSRSMYMQAQVSELMYDIIIDNKYNYAIIAIDKEFFNKYTDLSRNTFEYINLLKFIDKELDEIAEFDSIIVLHKLPAKAGEIRQIECVILSKEELHDDLYKERSLSIYHDSQNIDLKYTIADGFINVDIDGDMENNLLLNRPYYLK